MPWIVGTASFMTHTQTPCYVAQEGVVCLMGDALHGNTQDWQEWDIKKKRGFQLSYCAGLTWCDEHTPSFFFPLKFEFELPVPGQLGPTIYYCITIILLILLLI